MEFLTDKNLKGKKAFEYCRKSTESEDRQAFSLDDQHVINVKTIEHCELAWSQKDSCAESMSAKKRGRPLFNKLVDDIENGKYQVIVAWNLNRLARNSVDGAMLIEQMDNKKLFAIVTPGKTFFNSGDDKLLLQIEFGLAKKYSDDLGPTVMRGMHSKAKRGWLPGEPKVGYLNIKRDGEETVQTPDELRFPLLRKAFDLMLTGNYVPARVLDTLNNEWGFRTRATKKHASGKLSKTTFYSLLKDTFYYGKMTWGREINELNPALPRLITEEEYWRIQALLGSKGTPRPRLYFDLSYRGFIRCKECGSLCIPYNKQKILISGVKVRYPYLKCSKNNLSNPHCTQKQVSLEKLDTQIKKILENITISDTFFEWAVPWLKRDNTIETVEQGQILENLQNQLRNNQLKVSKLVDLSIEGLVSEEDFKNKRSELEIENKSLNLEITQLQRRTYDWLDLAIKAFKFAKNAKAYFDNGTPADKTAILRALGSNFILFDRKIDLTLLDPFLEFKNNREVVTANLKPFELGKSAMVTAKTSSLLPLKEEWSG